MTFARRSWAWTTLALSMAAVLGLSACERDGDESTETSAGGAGGSGPECAVGSHDDGTGTCVAELGAFIETSGILARRDHHVTWAATRPGGKFIYVAGGAVDMQTATTTIERAPIMEGGALGPWENLPQSL